MQGRPAAVRRAFLRDAANAGVQVCEGSSVKEVRDGELVLEDGSVAAFDACLWCTQGQAASWVSETGLPTGGKDTPQDTLFLGVPSPW